MIRLAIYILYIPVCVALVGASVWWFQETTSFENPILWGLWALVRMTPGVAGLTLLLCGGVLMEGTR